MARKDPRHAMHIKSRTEGSSNEISLSVLDAARQAHDAATGEGAEPTGKVSLFTLGKGKRPRSTPKKDSAIILPQGATPGRVLAPGSTARAMRQEGMRRGIITAIVIVCVALTLFLVGGHAFFTMTQQQNSLRETLTGQVQMIESCDDTLIPFDTLVMAQVDPDRLTPAATGERAPSFSELADGYRGVVADIAPVRDSLEAALSDIDALTPSLTDNRDREAAAQAMTAARSRLNMLDAGIGVIEESLKGTESFLAARSGWNALINADAVIRDATDAAQEMSQDTIEASRTLTEKALALLEGAQDDFERAESDYPGLDLTTYRTYVAKRIESQKAALAVDDAYLDRNKEDLASENDRYNALEEEAATLAAALEGNPESLVADRFYAAIADKTATYDAERLKAGNADAFLRDYLGSSVE